MKKIILTKGLPGSGKSTWALDFIKKNPDYKRINKDELRSMIDGGKWTHKNEKTILDVRDQMTEYFLAQGYSVIIDDTNFNLVHEARMRSIASIKDAQVEIKDFTDVPLEECIARDLKRANSVGEKVIKDMWKKNLRPPAEKPVFDENLPRCVLVDIDGTLALMDGRSPFEWTRVGEDRVNAPVAWLVETLKESKLKKEIIIFSGRDGSCRIETEAWLFAKNIEYDHLFMREAGDMRKDAIVKKEMFDANIKGKYNVMMVIDDRDQVVDMWRNELGLTCLQVAEGSF